MLLCIDRVRRCAARGAGVAAQWLLAPATARGRRAAFELHEHERGPDATVIRALAPLVALLLQRARTVLHLGQQRGELVPRLFVQQEGGAAQVHVVAVESTGLGGAPQVVRDLAERRVRQRAPQCRRQLDPVVVADQRRLERFVVVLDRAAPWLGAYELDHVQIREEPHVVADVAQRLVQLVGELARTGDLLVEQRQHSHSQRVRERLHDPLIDCGLVVRRHEGPCRGGPSVAGRGRRTLTVNPDEAMQCLHPHGRAWRAATILNAGTRRSRQHASRARTPPGARSAPSAASSARSMPASSTSRCVTARTRVASSASMTTSARASAAQNAGASATAKMTMFVSTVAGSMRTPGSCASPSASRRARAWSSARRSTWWSSAYRPAAATMPAWRIAPPSICFQRHASAISSAEPARHAPTGAPRPFVKSTHALSKPRAHAAASTPPATAALSSRAPSRCARSPWPRATSSTPSTCSSGHTRPPPMFVGCSTHTSRGLGA